MSARRLEPPVKIGRTGLRWTSFPNRVWEPGPGGWTSRPVTRDDVKRRVALAKRMQSVAFNVGEVSDGAVKQKVVELVGQLSIEEREKLLGWLRPPAELVDERSEPALIDGNDNEIGTVED